MLRNFFRPRLAWVLVLPLCFYLSHKVDVRDKVKDDSLQTISLEQYEAEKPRYEFVEYRAFGNYYDPNPYHVWQFVANACLVIGCLSAGKELLLPSTKNSP